MQCCNKISSSMYAGCGDPVATSGNEGDVYLNIVTMKFMIKNGCGWRIIGPCDITANVDFSNPNVGTTSIINVLANDTFSSTLTSFAITAPLDPVTEGTLTYNSSPINGLVTFTPAPRFLDSAIFGYQIGACNQTSSTVGKITANKSYSQNPAVLYANNTSQLFMYNISTQTSTLFITLPTLVSEVASNRGDALLYYTDPNVDDAIRIYDYVLKTTGILLNYSTYGYTGTATSLGFDNKRYFLYGGFATGNTIAKIAVNPYNRYVTPNTQTFSVSPITISVSGQATEITVQESTGFLYVSFLPTASPTVYIYKIDPTTGTIIQSTNTIYPDGHISFANNGLLYGIFSTTLVLIDQSTLALTTIGVGAPFVSDFAELLYNM